MLKLFATLLVFLLLALAVLGLHHHRLELTAQSARLRDHIRQQEHLLADQRVEIARTTDPRVLAEHLKKALTDDQGIPPDSAPGRIVPAGAANGVALPNPVRAPANHGLVTISHDSVRPLRHRMAE